MEFRRANRRPKEVELMSRRGGGGAMRRVPDHEVLEEN